MILRVLGLHGLTVAVVLLGLYALNVAKPNAIKAFLSMSLLMGLNLLAVLWVFRQIFSQKSIALSALIIVFKWTVIGVTLFFLVRHFQKEPLELFLGATTFVVPFGYFLWKGPKGAPF